MWQTENVSGLNKMTFYKIAGLNVAMEIDSPRLLESAAKYACPPFSAAHVLLADYYDEALRNHQIVNQVSIDMWTEILASDDFYRQLIKYKVMFLHSSAIVVDGWAYLISAPSQVGKSFHTNLWKEYLGPGRTKIINDDKPAVYTDNKGGWFAYGTPFSGASDSNLNEGAPIGGICVLERSKENWIRPEKGPKILQDLLKQTQKPFDEEEKYIIVNMFSKMVTEVPTYRIGVNTDIDAAKLVYETIRRY